MTYEKQQQAFFEWYANHQKEQEHKLQKYCSDKRIKWDDDVLADTVLKMAEKIGQSGIKDDSDVGFENYFFKAFKFNALREQQYARNARRDDNIGDIALAYENYYNSTFDSSDVKIKHDLWEDFAMYYLATILLEQYGGQLTHIFLEKYLYRRTYKYLQEKYSDVPRLRDKLLEMKRYLQENATKEEVEKAFFTSFDEIL